MGEITFRAKDKVIGMLIDIVSKINNGATIIKFTPEKLGAIILPESYYINEITRLKYDNWKQIYKELKEAGYPDKDLKRFKKLRGWK